MAMTIIIRWIKIRIPPSKPIDMASGASIDMSIITNGKIGKTTAIKGKKTNEKRLNFLPIGFLNRP